MTPQDIARHTDAFFELLDPNNAPVVDVKGFDMYSPQGFEQPALDNGEPFTVVSFISWSPKMKEQRQGWEVLMKGMTATFQTVYPKLPMGIIECPPVDNERIMGAIATLFWAKARRAIRGNLMFCDVDVIANRPTNPFECDFDVGLTDSGFDGNVHWPMMHINGGVQFVKDTPAAQNFYDRVASYALNFPQNGDPWYVGQMALQAVAKDSKDVNVAIFPHEMYNYAPDVYHDSDAYFIHFKGHRKTMHRDFVLPILERANPDGKIVLPDSVRDV